MIPNIQILEKTISPYMIMALLGLLVAYWYLYRQSEKLGLDSIHASRMGLLSAVGVYLGGMLLYGLTNIHLLLRLLENLDKATSFSQIWEALRVIFGGSVYYGGLIGCLLVSWIYLRRNKLPIGAYSDFGAPVIPLFHFFGRVGCFLSGCCYGIPWACGPVYHHSVAPGANGVPRFPVQLVEAAVNLALFFLLYGLLRRKKCQGQLLGLYLLIYPACRFVLEFFRGDEYRGFILGLSTSQFISVLLFASAVGFFLGQWTGKRRGKNLTQKNKPGIRPTE